MPHRADFQEFVERKTREAERAIISPLHTVEDRSSGFQLPTIGNAWTRAHYDGDFHLFDPPPSLPAVSMVFVQSRDGNTVVPDPASLGGGATDAHLIYEGLSRVAADAVLAGAASVGANTFFSVWHPELVSLRRDLGLSRHPSQVVLSQRGRVNLDALLFTVPDVPVFLILGEEGVRRCKEQLAERPWITMVPAAGLGLAGVFRQLRLVHGLARISHIGGRSAATAIVDAGLIQDLCLTTTAQRGGQPDTPYFAGRRPPGLELIVRKQTVGESLSITFEHFALTDV
jgi:riboflavin biosynthesis pyrimidine reductase